MLVITGATGNIGSKITWNLLNQGQKVRVVGRNARRLQQFVDKGAEAMVGDLADTQFLTRAFTGATAVFCILPPDITTPNVREHQKKMGESIATAIKNAGVNQVVNLSSVGAHLTENAGIVEGLHDQEQRLNAITGLNVVHLRAAYFMENILSAADMVKTQNIIGSPLNGALRFPTVATKDIADIATDYLINPTFRGHTVRHLLGPRDINYNEIVKVLGDVIGNRDLKYVQFPYEQARGAMVESGISESVASALTEMMKTMNEGPFLSEAHRTPETTTPTSIEEFARSVADYFKR
ncbi:MAG: NmrA family NAD(P)-binding protein [Candidatus Zixiibacteriota bacterium]|nr:MAG: NmrA family NAD(P)-binding protein [candidate division Zixibacteria bacterium]